MTDELLVRWLALAGARVAAARERLTDLDAAIGDGDHGINLDRGFRELLRRLETGLLPSDPPAAVLEGAVRAAVEAAGGASLAQVCAVADAERATAKLPPDWPDRPGGRAVSR